MAVECVVSQVPGSELTQPLEAPVCLWVSSVQPSCLPSFKGPMLSLQELGLLQEYLLALTTEDHLLRCAAQVPPPAPMTQIRPPHLTELGMGNVRVSESCMASPDPVRVYMELTSFCSQKEQGAPFITVTPSKLWGQKTLARIRVSKTKTASAFTFVG